MSDPINPNHYQNHPSGVQCIDIADKLGYSLGNCFKYLFRCGQKGQPLEDLKKAEWYLNRALETWREPAWWSRFLFGDFKECTEDQDKVLAAEDRYSGHMRAAMSMIFDDKLDLAVHNLEAMIRIEEHRIFSMGGLTWLNLIKFTGVTDWVDTKEGTFKSVSTNRWIKYDDVNKTKQPYAWREVAHNQILIA